MPKKPLRTTYLFYCYLVVNYRDKEFTIDDIVRDLKFSRRQVKNHLRILVEKDLVKVYLENPLKFRLKNKRITYDEFLRLPKE